VQTFLRQEFPTLPSYNRCVELMPRCFAGLFAFFQTVKGACTGISFIDSTKLPVRVNQNGGWHYFDTDTSPVTRIIVALDTP